MSKDMTDQELKNIEDRCKHASKGPWLSFIEGRDHESGDSFIMTGTHKGDDKKSNSRGEDIYLIGATNADQDFIAHSRQDVPRLLEEIKKLRKK
jgi:hypothetical protein